MGAEATDKMRTIDQVEKFWAKHPQGSIYSRVLNVSEYVNGDTQRKPWEIDVVLEALEDSGRLTSQATILGVGAGTDPVSYMIANKVNWVFMTDLYMDSGNWNSLAPQRILTNHDQFSPQGGYSNRVIPIHRDGRDLGFPDESIDAIYSLGSIEHFGDWDEIAQSAREIGRVLKPGGMAAITTEFKISGEGWGWPGVALLSMEDIQEHIVKPSGLQLATRAGHPEDFQVNQETLATEWPLLKIVKDNQWPLVEGVLAHEGFTFTSVFLALFKE